MRLWLCIGALALLALTACNEDMANQRRYEPLEKSQPGLWPPPARHAAAGAVPHDAVLDVDAHTPPVISRALLEEGQKQFDIFCAPCHGISGEGNGIVVQRGFPAPPSFHSDALRAMPLKYFYQVISHGKGKMYSYANRLAPPERWATASYIRALQYSQHVPVSELDNAQRARLEPAP